MAYVPDDRVQLYPVTGCSVGLSCTKPVEKSQFEQELGYCCTKLPDESHFVQGMGLSCTKSVGNEITFCA